MSDNMDYDYSYDENAVTRADRNANKITEGGAYIGSFKVAAATTSQHGARGVEFDFEVPDGGRVGFTLWTHGRDSKQLFGYDQLMGLAFLMGAKLKAAPGKVEQWVDGPNGRERAEVDGMRYPEMEGQQVGIFLEKELTGTKDNDGNKFRFNFFGAFNPTTKLTASEIKERKVKPEKYDRLLRQVQGKVRDGRKAAPSEPAQPGMGVPEGGY
jgi:hypothetical protein